MHVHYLRNSLVTTHEDLGIVLVKSTLVVSDSRHVLDDNAVVGVLALLVQNVVGLNHVVHDVGLGDLLGAELLLGAQVLAVVVAQVVVAGNGSQLDTSIDKEVNKSRLHLGLAGLEVITADEGVVLLSQLNGTRDKGVLRRTVDEGCLVENTGDSKNGGGRNLFVALLNGLEEVVSSVVDAGNDVGISLSVGSPHDNDLVEAVVRLEVTDILTELLNVGVASLAALEDIVGTVFLVGSNEVRVVDGLEGDHLSHLLLDEGLQSGLKDLSAVHGLSQVHLANVPTTNNEVIGVDHGQNIVEGDVDVGVGLGIRSKLHGRSHNKGAVVVGLTGTLLGVPDEVAAVGENTSSDSGTIVAAPADQHHADLGNLAVDLEVILSLLGSSNKVAIGVSLDAGSTVGVLGLDLGVRIGDIGRVDDESSGGSSGSAVSGNRPVRGARGNLRVGSHIDKWYWRESSVSLDRKG